jgi:hypothetical protein
VCAQLSDLIDRVQEVIGCLASTWQADQQPAWRRMQALGQGWLRLAEMFER